MTSFYPHCGLRPEAVMLLLCVQLEEAREGNKEDSKKKQKEMEEAQIALQVSLQ